MANKVFEFFSKVGQLAEYKMDDMISKARAKNSHTVIKPRTVYVDESAIYDQGGFTEKSSIVTFDILRQVAEKDMITTAIINKLVNRVAAFSTPQKDKYSLGFLIKHRDPDKKALKRDAKVLREIQNFLLYTGYKTPGRPTNTFRNFDTFIRILTRDALIYNQIAIECIYAKDGGLSYIVPVSGGTIRHAVKDLATKYKDFSQMVFAPEGLAGREKEMRKVNAELDKIRYIQVYRNQILSAYTESELIYKQRVPSVEIVHAGYAMGELEWLINTVASHRIAESHNEVFFKQGFSGNGILNIKTDMTQEDLEGVRRMFIRQGQGVRNSHRQMIFAVPQGLEWLQMSQLSNKDMEFSQWMEYLIKLMCAVYGLNPSEINFDISRGGAAPALSDSGFRNEIILKDTRNSILRPLLHWIACIINDDIFPRLNPEWAEKFEFEFVGLDAEDEERELERLKSKVTTYMTINEIREEAQKEPLQYGDIILDSAYLQYILAKNPPPDPGAPPPEDTSPIEEPGDPKEDTAQPTEGKEKPNKKKEDSELSALLDEITAGKASKDKVITLAKALKEKGLSKEDIKIAIKRLITEE